MRGSNGGHRGVLQRLLQRQHRELRPPPLPRLRRRQLMRLPRSAQRLSRNAMPKRLWVAVDGMGYLLEIIKSDACPRPTTRLLQLRAQDFGALVGLGLRLRGSHDVTIRCHLLSLYELSA